MVRPTFSYIVDTPKDPSQDALLTETQLSQALIHNPLPRFLPFTRLPPEIRIMIWDLAIPKGQLRLQMKCYCHPDDRIISFPPSLLPPAVAQVCRESRAVACRSGIIVSFECPNCSEELKSWYDSGRDKVSMLSTA